MLFELLFVDKRHCYALRQRHAVSLQKEEMREPINRLT